MAKVLTKIWNHKKKVIFFSAVGGIGVNYGLQQKRLHDAMRALCLDAKRLGDATVTPGQENIRKAVVILNYGAHKAKARKMYENFAAPLLNLAGIQTTIYATNDTAKLYEYLEHIEKCDAVIFAGGDSTISECVQSYIKLGKPEFSTTPVGILPLGYSNVVLNALRPSNLSDSLKIAHAALDIVKGVFRPGQVLETKNGDKDEKLFAISGLEWGPIKDIENRVPKYWLLGPFDSVFAYSLAAIKQIMKPVTAAVEYIDVCPGCDKCVMQSLPVVEEQQPKKPVSGRWWQSLIRSNKLPEVDKKPEVMEPVDLQTNLDCGVLHSKLVRTRDLHIISANVPGLKGPSDDRGFMLTFRKMDSDTFISRIRQRARMLQNVPKQSDHAEYERRTVSEMRILPTEQDKTNYPSMEIDGHPVDLASGVIQTKISPQKILLFCNNEFPAFA